jgi:replicative DNA helicase
VIIGKQRHGPIGKVELHYDGRFTRFSNWSHEANPREFDAPA